MRSILLYLFLLSVPMHMLAQRFQLMRYDEDYSALKDSTRTFYNKIKYIPLSQTGAIYLSLGGEVREELDYSANEDWGEMRVGRDVFWLQRYQVHADLHVGNRIRFFGQLRSGLENGRKNGPRRIDEDKLNVENLFVDFLAYRKLDKALTLRVGRQEIQYGSGRLIDVRDGPNLRLYFDGAKLAYASPSLNVDAFVMAEAKINTGFFDNSSTREANLWGIYSTYIIQQSGNFDFYYLGINRADATFDEGVAKESRHTLGARFWRRGGGFIYNFEGAYQFGKFGIGNIKAWTASAEVGYMFENIPGAPTINLRHDYISGDKTKGDGTLGTFNPLYPKGGYFGFNPQVGPVNLIDLHPYLAWNAAKNVALTLDVVFNWRYSLQDGVYRPDGSFNMSSSNSAKRYIGTAYLTSVSWDMNRFLNFNIGIQYFKTGDYIKDVIPQYKDGFFASSVIGFKF